LRAVQHLRRGGKADAPPACSAPRSTNATVPSRPAPSVSRRG
jgi:hypothetical protein